MSEKNLIVRFSVKDQDIVKRALTQLGDDGQKVLSRLEQSTRAPSAGLKALNAASEEVHDTIKELAHEGGSVGHILSAIGPGGLVAAAGLVTLYETVEKSLESFGEFERLQFRLQGVLNATGNSAGLNAKEMVELAEEIEKSTFSTKEQVLQAESVLATFGNVTGENFKKTIELAASMAEVMGTDVADAARTLGKSLSDPEEGMKALRKAGVVLTESERDVVKSFVEARDTAGAQSAMIEDLGKRYDGVAKQSAAGLAGSQKHLKDSFHDVFEAIGDLIASTGSVTGFFEAVGKKAEEVAESVKVIAEYIKIIHGETGKLDDKQLAVRIEIDKKDIAETQKAIEQLQHPSESGIFSVPIFGGSDEAISDLQKKIKQLTADIAEAQVQKDKLSVETPKVVEDNKPKISESFEEYLDAKREELRLSKLAEVQQVRQKAEAEATAKFEEDRVEVDKEKVKKAGDIAVAIFNQKHAQEAANEAAKEAVKIANERKSLLEKIMDVEGETNAIRNGTTGEYQIQKEVNAARKAAIDLNEKDREVLLKKLDIDLHQKKAEEDLKKARDDAFEEFKKQAEEQQKLLQEPYLNAARGIQDAFSSTFEDIFSKGINSFSDLATKIKSVMIKMAAEVSAATVFRPVVGGVLGSVSPSIAQSITGAPPTSILSTLSNLNRVIGGAGGGIFGGELGGSIDAFGARYLGLGQGSSFVGPMLPGVSVPGTSLSGLLGTAGLGAGIGGILASVTGGNSIAGSFGGAAGSLLGNFVLPGIGGWIGGALGGGLGGLIGNNKPSNRLQDDIIDLSNGSIVKGGQTGNKFSQENRDLADSITSTVTSIAGAISTSLGQSITQQIRIAVGGRTGYQAGAVGSEVTYGSVQDLLKGVTLSLTSGLKNVPAELKTALDHLDFKNVEQAVNDINFALNFGKLSDMPKTLTQVEAAVQGLNKQFDDAVNVAHRLGLSEAEVNTARQKQLGYLRDQFNTSINDQILALADNTASQIVTIRREFENNLKDATALGATTSQIEQLRDLKIKAALEQQISQQTQEQNKLLTEQANTFSQAKSKWESFTASIRSYEKSLNLSNLSPLSPEARLNEARSQFESLASRAQIGDQDAIAELQNASNSLLQESKSYYASSENYFRDFNRVQDVLKNTEELTIRQSSIADRQLSETQKQTELLQKIADGTASISPAGNANTKLLASEHIVNGKRMFGNATEDQVWAAILASGFTGQGGGGAVTRFFDSNAAANTKATSLFKALGIPGFANGGYASGLALVGERGPELAYFGNGARVFSNSDSRKMVSNDNSDVVSAIKNMHADHNTAWQRASQQNAALRAEVAQLRAENTDIKNYLRKVASKPK